MRTLAAIAGLVLIPLLSVADETETEIHRRIYVPLDEWEQVLREEPRGLMLTRQEYDDLLQRARRVSGHLDEGGLPPVGGVVREARYEATLIGERCSATAHLKVDVVREGWVIVPLGLGGTAPADATLAGEPALLLPVGGGGFQLLTQGARKGDLEIPFSSRATETAGGYLVRFGLAPAAAGIFTFRVPGEWEFSEEGAAGQSGFDLEKGESWFRTPVGGRTGIVLHLTRKAEGKQRRPITLLEKDLAIRIDEAGIDGTWAMACTILREKRSELDLALPEGLDLAGVSAPDLQDWQILDGGILRLRLQKPVKGRLPVRIRMRAATPQGGELDLPEIRGVDVDREWGRMSIDLLGGMRGRLVSSRGVREIPYVGEEPRGVPFRSFAWAGQGREIRIAVERPTARLHADVRTMVEVRDEGITLRSRLLYTAPEGEVLSLHPRLPADLELDSVLGEGIPLEWRDEGDGKLWVNLASKLSGDQKVHLLVEGRLPRKASLPIPKIRAGADREEGYVAFAVEGGYSLLGDGIADWIR